MPSCLLSDRYNYRVKIINDIAGVMMTLASHLAAIKVSLVHGILRNRGLI